jgi:hypothetical protein
MAGEAEGEGDDGERRVGAASGRKDAAAGDVEIGGPEQPAIGIDHAGRGIGRYPGGAHVVVGAEDRVVSLDAVVLEPWRQVEPADAEPADLLADQQGELPDRALVDLAKTPVEPDPRQAGGILLVA